MLNFLVDYGERFLEHRIKPLGSISLQSPFTAL